ncbi:MAG: branched-chain amino acid ABC transporter permease, partial [Actinomycetota bacterium]
VGAMSWALATSLAVVSALLTGMQSPVSPLLIGATLKGFSVALVGGLDSLAGIAPAALLIALMEVLVIQFVDQQLGQTVPFVVMLAVLMLRPWGLRGTVEELDRV